MGVGIDQASLSAKTKAPNEKRGEKCGECPDDLPLGLIGA
jgi:hypothetical protein